MIRPSAVPGEDPVRPITVLALICFVFLCAMPGGARAQVVPPGDTENDFGPQVHDYFARDQDPSISVLLRTVERYHLSDSFWQSYRRNEFGAARADLRYVLQRFPNHPRALQLSAYDENVKLDPSQVIQLFEIAIRSFPSHAYTYAQYGHYLVSIGRKTVGLELLDQALRLDPDLVAAIAWRAEGETAGPQMPTESTDGSGGKRPLSKSPEGSPRRKR